MVTCSYLQKRSRAERGLTSGRASRKPLQRSSSTMAPPVRLPVKPPPIVRHVRGPDESASSAYASVPLDTDRLRDLRLQRKWSQHVLSVQVGVQGAAAISAWERGLTVPRPNTLCRVADALGVEPVELLAVDGDDALALRELRVSRGKALRDLASAAQTSVSTVRRWENVDFVRMPAADVVRCLAHALRESDARVIAALEQARRAAQARV